MKVITNGLVADGTGSSAFLADVVVEGDKITDIIPKENTIASYEGIETFDASGCLVTPGFIDAHSHSDTYLLIEPDAPSKISQGITTEINGQCGGSAIPRYGEARLDAQRPVPGRYGLLERPARHRAFDGP